MKIQKGWDCVANYYWRILWDLVGNNTPIFFIKDAKKFPDFIHTQKRDPYTNCKSATAVWDFWGNYATSSEQIRAWEWVLSRDWVWTFPRSWIRCLVPKFKAFGAHS